MYSGYQGYNPRVVSVSRIIRLISRKDYRVVSMSREIRAIRVIRVISLSKDEQ